MLRANSHDEVVFLTG